VSRLILFLGIVFAALSEASSCIGDSSTLCKTHRTIWRNNLRYVVLTLCPLQTCSSVVTSSQLQPVFNSPSNRHAPLALLAP